MVLAGLSYLKNKSLSGAGFHAADSFDSRFEYLRRIFFLFRRAISRATAFWQRPGQE